MGKLKHVFIGEGERCEICRMPRKVHPEKGVVLERIPTPTEAIQIRAAEALGWSLKDVQSFSLQMLREILRPDPYTHSAGHPKLVLELDYLIRGNYIYGREN
jgi:hypothetical protein